MVAPRFFRARLVRGGPVIGVRMFVGPPVVDGEELDRSLRLQVLVDNETTSRAVLMLGDGDIPVEIDGATLRSIDPISEAEYHFLVAHSAWAQEHVPDHPKAKPREPVDFSTILPF